MIVLYLSLRRGLQEALNDYTAEHGTKPVRVVTAEKLIEELEQGRPGEG